MNERFVKNSNGFLMIAIHFGALYYIFDSVSARLEPSDQLSLVLILAPLTATFVTLFLKDLVVRARESGIAAEYSKSFSIVTILLTILYGGVIFFMLNNFLRNPDISADMLKLNVGVIETIIGEFVGLVYGELFRS